MFPLRYKSTATPTALMPYPAFLHYANETFRVLQGGYKIRISEATHALCLFEQVVSEHINHPPFTLLRNNLHILLLSCALVTHKFSTDRPIRNICWSESFGVPLTLLNLSEVSLLYLLGWRVAVSEGELGRIKAQCEEAM
ncbi:hypothetical protein BLNAU_11769 [Blattamonas nauphoetae]|uniref:Cyclin N-terminal domain-containing protein n=1 Tax=Blattamonas nauphoetae TaxID=2049346 RepID=A0ABQ9XS09_9EUKA|nr:hypothetical protein BLNAU_11769 [Blattamonas nauphoetae]